MKKILYSVGLIFFMIVSSAGCIKIEDSTPQPSPGLEISYLAGEMPLNYSEVVSINFSAVKAILENKSWIVDAVEAGFQSKSVSCWFYIMNASSPHWPPEYSFIISASSQNNTTSAKLEFRRVPPYQYSPNETYETDLLKQKVNEITRICNLTSDLGKSDVEVVYEQIGRKWWVDVSWVTITIPLNYNEVASIDSTIVKPIFENKSYVFRNLTDENGIVYTAEIPNKYDPYRPLFYFWISTSENNFASLKFKRAPPYQYSPNETYEINLIKEKAAEVTQICNLTLNWTGVEFNIAYSD
ncbi:MAG: hypothetical protein WC974_04960 [Thermoplasmata archaeon]